MQGRLLRFAVLASLGGAVFLLVVYAVSLRLPHVTTDRYYFFVNGTRTECAQFPQYTFYRQMGRPLAAWLDCQAFLRTDALADLTAIRLSGLALQALGVGLLAACFARAGLAAVPAFLASAAAMTLPGFQFMNTLATFSWPLAIVLALVSWLLADVDGSGREPANATRLAGSVVTLVLANLIYPPFAALILVPAVARVLFANPAEWPSTRWKTARDVAVFGSASLAYFALNRWILLPRLPPHAYEAYRFELTADVGAKLRLLSSEVSVVGLRLWSVYHGTGVSIAAAVVLAVGSGAAWWRVRSEPVRTRIGVEAALLAGLLALLANTSLLAGSGAIVASRTVVAWGAMSVLLVAWSIRSCAGQLRDEWRAPSLTAVLGLCVLAGGLSAMRNTSNNAENAHRELAFIRHELARQANKPLRQIHVVRSASAFDRSYTGLPVSGDEFNANSSAYPPYVPWMVRLALTQVLRRSNFWVFSCVEEGCSVADAPADQIVVTTSGPGDPLPSPEGVWLVDMNVLERAAPAD